MTYDGDVQLRATDDGGDVLFANGQPAMDPGLTTAVFISLFTGSDWWGNAIAELDEQIGSGFETVMDRALSIHTMLDVEEKARRALAWMTEQGVAERVSVRAQIQSSTFLALEITVQEPGLDIVQARFRINWENQSVILEAA